MWQLILGFLLFIGGIVNLGSNIEAFFGGILLGILFIYLGIKKIERIPKIQKAKVTVPVPVEERYPATLEIPRLSTVEGNFWRSWSPDDVKFYPPDEIIASVPKGIFIPGAEVILKWEPSNSYDPNAIALYLSGYKIGYLLRGGLQDMVHEWNEKQWPVECRFVSLKISRDEYQGYVALAFYRPKEGPSRLGYSDIDIKSIKPTDPDTVPNTPLTGKKVVFCGYFDLPLEEMMQQAVDSGATLRAVVTKTVDYLIVGKNNGAFVDESGLTSKEATATRLNEQGLANIRIITEQTFLELAQIDL